MRVGVLTSGGDAPGMNAAIRAVVRTAVYEKIDVFGIQNGFDGLINKDIIPLNVYSAADIIDRGGTFLKTSRSEFFKTVAGKKAAKNILSDYGIDHLIIIGGDGSLKGALSLQELDVSVIGIPATIDNDFGATDLTIGFDTAVTTATEAVEKIRDTSISHNRINVVQVMGRKCGDIALYTGFGIGAEAIIIPEVETDIDAICSRLIEGKDRGKLHSIVMLAEGCGDYKKYCQAIEERTKVETRGSDLGYIQRGGSPTLLDRYLASNMGYQAVQAVVNGNTGTVVVYRKGKFELLDMASALKIEKVFNADLYHRMKVLSI